MVMRTENVFIGLVMNISIILVRNQMTLGFIMCHLNAVLAKALKLIPNSTPTCAITY